MIALCSNVLCCHIYGRKICFFVICTFLPTTKLLLVNIDIVTKLRTKFEVYFILINYVLITILRWYVLTELSETGIEICYALFHFLLALEGMLHDALPWNIFDWKKRFVTLP
eukprot:UN08457